MLVELLNRIFSENAQKCGYGEINYRLTEEFARVTFVKKDGASRVMLCTRSNRLIELYCRKNANELAYIENGLASRSSKCTPANGSIAVVDMSIDEVRAISTGKILKIEWLGKLDGAEDLDAQIAETFKQSNEWKKFDDMDDAHKEIILNSLL